VVVDANVERVVARLFAIATPLPAARPAIRAAADAVTPDARAGDFAQAMMDLGSAICTTRAPKCLLCPLREECAAFATGAPEAFPVKAAKKAKPQRYGTIFWLEQDGAVLLVRRPAKGLLGGMRALPTGAWSDALPGLEGAPAQADWRLLEQGVRHSFTHFDLDLALAVAETVAHQPAPDGEWWPVDGLASAGLPTVFAKAGVAIRSRA
jgi:A/G-specific adenine glycosylase